MNMVHTPKSKQTSKKLPTGSKNWCSLGSRISEHGKMQRGCEMIRPTPKPSGENGRVEESECFSEYVRRFGARALPRRIRHTPCYERMPGALSERGCYMQLRRRHAPVTSVALTMSVGVPSGRVSWEQESAQGVA